MTLIDILQNFISLHGYLYVIFVLVLKVVIDVIAA